MGLYDLIITSTDGLGLVTNLALFDNSFGYYSFSEIIYQEYSLLVVTNSLILNNIIGSAITRTVYSSTVWLDASIIDNEVMNQQSLFINGLMVARNLRAYRNRILNAQVFTYKDGTYLKLERMKFIQNTVIHSLA